jgi:hypothetical protein
VVLPGLQHLVSFHGLDIRWRNHTSIAERVHLLPQASNLCRQIVCARTAAGYTAALRSRESHQDSEGFSTAPRSAGYHHHHHFHCCCWCCCCCFYCYFVVVITLKKNRRGHCDGPLPSSFVTPSLATHPPTCPPSPQVPTRCTSSSSPLRATPAPPSSWPPRACFRTRPTSPRAVARAARVVSKDSAGGFVFHQFILHGVSATFERCKYGSTVMHPHLFPHTTRWCNASRGRSQVPAQHNGACRMSKEHQIERAAYGRAWYGPWWTYLSKRILRTGLGYVLIAHCFSAQQNLVLDRFVRRVAGGNNYCNLTDGRTNFKLKTCSLILAPCLLVGVRMSGPLPTPQMLHRAELEWPSYCTFFFVDPRGRFSLRDHWRVSEGIDAIIQRFRLSETT